MNTVIVAAAIFLFLSPLGAQQQALPGWKFGQKLTTSAPGVYKYELPLEILDEALPLLTDLRLLDAAGKEAPYLLEAARPAPVKPARLKGFISRAEGTTTVLTARAGDLGYVDCVVLETPAASFIKPADIYVSLDGKQWAKAGGRVAVFRQAGFGENLLADLAPIMAKYVKVVVSDVRAAPVPFTGLSARVLPRAPAKAETLTAAILAKEDYASSSRLTVRLPARNLFVRSVELSVHDKQFSRGVAVSARSLEDGRMVSRQLASGNIFSTDAAGFPAARAGVPVYAQFRDTDEMVLEVDNGGGPPLDIKEVKITCSPVTAVFRAKGGGVYRLFFGNREAPSRNYDLSGLAGYQKGKDISSPTAGKMEKNPAFSGEEALPAQGVSGGPINAENWLYKTPVSVKRAGVQGLELNLQTIVRAERDLRDLRLIGEGAQVPYILDRDYTLRSLPVAAESEGKSSPVSLWRVKLPYENFPLSQLTAVAPDTIFQRRVTLFETALDGGGRAYRRLLGSAVWSSGGRGAESVYAINASVQPSGGELEFEIENGGNKPLDLSGFRLYYPVTRLIFKWKGDGGLWLYYGNRGARTPAYDISRLLPELLREEKQPARLEGEGGDNQGWGNFKLFTALSGAAFWTVLAAAAAMLIFLAVRLLPSSRDGE